MQTIPIDVSIPDAVRVSGQELKLLLALKLYETEKLSLGQAAQAAGLSKRTFIEIMGQYGVSLFDMSADELQKDITNA